MGFLQWAVSTRSPRDHHSGSTKVPGLESDNSGPAELVEVDAQLCGGVYNVSAVNIRVSIRTPVTKRTAQSNIVVVVQLVDSLDLSTDVEFLNLGVEVLDGRVLRITAKDQLGFLLPKPVQFNRQSPALPDRMRNRAPRQRGSTHLSAR